MDEVDFLKICLIFVLGLPVVIEILKMPSQIRRMREKHSMKYQQRLDQAYMMNKEFNQQEAERMINIQNNNTNTNS